MIKIENVILPSAEQWRSIILGARNAMNSWSKSDSYYVSDVFVDEDDNVHDLMRYKIGPNDYNLMKKLCNAGTDHRKFMRMIVVYVDVTAPLYWWKEFDTYKVGTVANSCSTMHKIAAKKFSLEDFSCEHLLQQGSIINELRTSQICAPICDRKIQYTPMTSLMVTIAMLNRYRDFYLELENMDKESFEKWKETNRIDSGSVADTRKLLWWQMIQLLPSSYNQKRTVMLNYEVLANIYKSRKNHKLDEWVELCKWIETLPYSELIIGKYNEDTLKE